MNNQAMFKLSYGLFVLTAQDEAGKANGCIINTAIQAASDPNTVTICVNKQNYTHDLIMKTNKFNVSILSEKATFDLFTHFGFQSGRDVDKFADFKDYKVTGNGLPVITKGTNAYISGWVRETVDLGSHTMFIATVADMDVLDEATPSCTYAYYFANIKPKPQPKAEEGKVTWVCKICGYVYEGDPIPEDFICPLCKHPASDFERVVS